MTGLGALVGIFLVGFGVLSLVAPDAMWAFQRFSNRLEGQVSERSGTWEFGRIVGGILCIILGIVIFVMLSRL